MTVAAAGGLPPVAASPVPTVRVTNEVSPPEPVQPRDSQHSSEGSSVGSPRHSSTASPLGSPGLAPAVARPLSGTSTPPAIPSLTRMVLLGNNPNQDVVVGFREGELERETLV